MAQRELIRELVERSHERVVQVRAGNSLHRALQQDVLSRAHPMTKSLPNLPPPPLAIMPKLSAKKPPKMDEEKTRRRRDALPRLASNKLQLPEEATSFEQYQHFMDSKLYREETLHQRQRRAALAPKADLLKKLAAVCAAAMAEMEKETNSPVVRESLREKLLGAMALLRGGRAFKNAKSLAPPPPPAFGEIKNAHLAFLEFKRHDVHPANEKRLHPSAGLQDGNTSAKTPIHFGDQICLLSLISDAPLVIGPDGRSRVAQDNSAGPHMTFTVVDFRNPSRYDEVTSTDDFWLRVDSTYLAPRKHFDPRRLYFHRDDSDQTGEGDDGDDLASFLSDTSYYLGCPGWLDDEEQKESTASTNVQARRQNSLRRGHQRFSLIAMKALTPARAYYGDDAATREYSVETNEGIMRLARWRFVRYIPRRYEQHVGKTQHNCSRDCGCNDSEPDVNDALVNCATVHLVLSDFALVYDEVLKRGIGVRVASDSDSASKAVLKLSGEHRKKPRSYHHGSNSNDGEVVANVAYLSDCARWQVRLLQRTGGMTYLQELELAMAAVTGDVEKEDGARVEWLRKKQEKVAVNERRLRANGDMVLKARRQYDLVAEESNSKLQQIERQKAAQAPEYFQRRLQVLTELENNHQPYEIAQKMHQQLQRVVELPRI